MYSEFIKNGFCIVKNFIDTDAIQLLKDNIKNNDDIGKTKLHVNTTSKDLYGTSEVVSFLCKKIPEVSAFIGEDVIPTYGYTRIYRENSVLDSHLDRPSCEVSLTVHLDGDCEWDFWIKGYNGEKSHFSLNPGDAILYDGCQCEHGRTGGYKGKEYFQMFLHYVRSKGENAHHYFDRIHIPNAMSLKTHIKIYDDIVDESLCERILKEYSNCSEWEKALTWGETTSNEIETENPYRNCDTVFISKDNVIGDSAERREIDNKLFEAFNSVLRKYHQYHPFAVITQDTGYELLRYSGKQYYKEHVDHFSEAPRQISASLILNDDFEGGEFSFFDGTVNYKVKKGSVICFPSSFVYPHQILPVTKGVRYSIVTWFH